MAITHNSRADDIMTHFLSQLTQGILTRDYDIYRPLFDLPYEVFSFEGHARIETDTGLRAMFDRVTDYYARLGVIDLLRIAREISHPSPQRLRCLYETREINERQMLHGEPFFCLTELECKDGRWVVQRSEYDIVPTDVRHDVLIGTHASVGSSR